MSMLGSNFSIMGKAKNFNLSFNNLFFNTISITSTWYVSSESAGCNTNGFKKSIKKTKIFYFGYIIWLVSSAYCKARTGNLLVSYLHTAI